MRWLYRKAVLLSTNHQTHAPPVLPPSLPPSPFPQTFVDEITCIGCGKCVRACTGVFEIEESKYGRARVINQTGDSAEAIEIAIQCCPVDCIHMVGASEDEVGRT
jgi:ferredoxin